MQKKKVAIVTTIYKETPTVDEKISLNHLYRFLNNYDKYVLVPESSGFQLSGFKAVQFPKKYFTSAKANADLLFSKELYQKFIDYDYILIYELDSLVFSDDLIFWCEKGYDYIGAPWIKSQMIKRYDFPDAVGNGGFALRRVESFIKVLENGRHPFITIFKETIKALKTKKTKGLVELIIDIWSNTPKRTKMIEDRFWSFKAKLFMPEFNVAPVEEGLKFAFEINPRENYKTIGNKLPFGCHAWARYDRDFWEPYLIIDDKKIN